ncbi:MAG: HAMP domain-containing histidine kinase [Ruminococcus sp.]|nr:HAMP domain-containing histidine kinase [Ruminococcus sp.]
MIKNKKIRRPLVRRRKRTTFLRIFAKAAVVMLIISGIFAVLFREYIEQYIYHEIDGELARAQSSLMRELTDESKSGNPNAAETELRINYPYWPTTAIPIFASYYLDDDSAAISVLLDKDGNEIATNEMRFMAVLKFEKTEDDSGKRGKQPENGWYICKYEELDIPELTEFCEKMLTIEDEMDHESQWSSDTEEHIDFIVKSAYVNKAEHLFIPHEMTLEYKTVTYQDKEALSSIENISKTENYTINADVEGYELTEIHKSSEEEYPQAMLPYFQGTGRKKFNTFWNAVKDTVTLHTTDSYSGMSGYGNFEGLKDKCDGRVYYMNTNYSYNGEDCKLCTVFCVGLWNSRNNKVYAVIAACFTALMLFIAFLYSWRKNVLNKADYAFEDYQKDLTNNLAHDLKTPLAAIGGYAENLMEMAEDEKQQKYLRSILDNVAYTDSMISKTLELNSGNVKKPEKTKFNMRQLAESALEKYRVQLDERGIETAVDSDMDVDTDKDLMTSAVENLVSNAVKYTRNDGEIKIKMNKGEFKITNDVSEKIDTHDLTKPFVRGDKNRSGRSGSGLGLSIADRSLTACGYILELDCTDTVFTAIIRG